MWCGSNKYLFTWYGTEGGPDVSSVSSLCFTVRGSSAGRSSCRSTGHLIRYTPTCTYSADSESYGCEWCGCVYILNRVVVLRAKLPLQCFQWRFLCSCIPHTGLFLHQVLQPTKFLLWPPNMLNLKTSKGTQVLCPICNLAALYVISTQTFVGKNNVFLPVIWQQFVS